jgi:hypothetical protein
VRDAVINVTNGVKKIGRAIGSDLRNDRMAVKQAYKGYFPFPTDLPDREPDHPMRAVPDCGL